MTYDTIQWHVDAGVLTLTLHRPEQLNAFTLQMRNELVDAFERASEDDAVRAIVVTGAGRSFCAGMDLAASGDNVFGIDGRLQPTVADMHERLDDPEFASAREPAGKLALAIYDCKKPVIGAINGPAVGIGATMTLAMDIRLASQKARIGFVFGKLGIVPEACSTWFLPRLVGMQQAFEWLYSAEIFDADEALRGGLVKAVYPPETLLDEAHKLARKFTENRSPVSVALIRQMLLRNSAQTHPIEAHRIESLGVFYTSIADGQEGVRAFLEKRAPQFAGKASEMPPIYPWWR
ncbi:MAG: crotonase/enoyl-CoA hydratase family protein [Polyangiales bacterium]